jgi:hypothetical protein
MALQTPWLRDELRLHLANLADEQWLTAELDDECRPGDALDEVLDFPGVVDAPEAGIGYVLLDEQEAAAMPQLGSVLDAALDERAHERWLQVPAGCS